MGITDSVSLAPTRYRSGPVVSGLLVSRCRCASVRIYVPFAFHVVRGTLSVNYLKGVLKVITIVTLTIHCAAQARSSASEKARLTGRHT